MAIDANIHARNFARFRRIGLSCVLLLIAPPAFAAPEGSTMLSLSSSVFAAGQSIPKKYTCEGDDVSPPLAWTGAPAKTRSFALIVDDPDAPDPAAPQRVWVHWVLYNISPATRALAEAASARNIPPGAAEGTNDWSRSGYGGPCPPIGRHRYFFKLYALDDMLRIDKPPNKAALEAAMKGHILAQAELIGTYQKSR